MSETIPAQAASWLPYGEENTDFPLQNLPVAPLKVRGNDGKQRITLGVALGNYAFSLETLFSFDVLPQPLASWTTQYRDDLWGAFLAAPRSFHQTLRISLYELFHEGSSLNAQMRETLARSAYWRDESPFAPVRIPNYTDFYAGIHHATRVGKLFRPDNPLLPNYVHVPIGYHGRASSIRLSGKKVPRPYGQRKGPQEDTPTFGPSERLDYELELGAFIREGTALGTSLSIEKASEAILGFVLVNDWSARDIQAWEYQPLGPFLAKSFFTTISPWIVLPDALEPFKAEVFPRTEQYPSPLPYLSWKEDFNYDLTFEVMLQSEQMRKQSIPPCRIARTNSKHLFWSFAQLITHHSSNGCNLEAGDLIASGTISGSNNDECGCLLETTEGGKKPIELPSGETRSFLADGDEVLFTGWGEKEGYPRIGFGECRGLITQGKMGSL